MTMAGDGEVEQAAALAQSLGCAEEIRVRSWLRPDEVRQLLTESDIFVLPSRGEGMSTALLEAMGWGLAIITTSEGGADEFLKDGSSALLVPAGGVPDITRAIERLVNDEGLRLSLGRHARRAAIPFDIRHHVDRLMGIYRGVARQPHEKRVARDHGVETPRPAGTMD
jgi:glycosyltransferase involved in cell wall biosynthesis